MEERMNGGNRGIGGEYGWWWSEENSSNTGKHPGLVELRDIQVHVRTGVFDAGRNIVNDEAKIMGVGGEPKVVERSVRIVPSDKNRTATKIARVLGRVSKCIHRPRSIFCVRSKIMDARLAGRNRRISLLDGRRLRGAQNVAAGELPV